MWPPWLTGLPDPVAARGGEAAEHLLAAESILSATAEPDFLPLARARFTLARALAGAVPPRPVAARARAEAALAAFRARDRQDEARAVEAWLAQPR